MGDVPSVCVCVWRLAVSCLQICCCYEEPPWPARGTGVRKVRRPGWWMVVDGLVEAGRLNHGEGLGQLISEQRSYQRPEFRGG